MKKRLKEKVIRLGFVVAITLTIGTTACNTTVASDVTEAEEIHLSEYEYEISFESPEEIEMIAEAYDLENPEEIEEIVYVPIVDDSLEKENIDSEISTAEVGAEEYYVKRKNSVEKKGALLRSSWYRAPGGSMTISESVATTVSFANSASIEGGTAELKAVLKAEYGFSMTKKRSVSDTQNVKVPSGYKKNVKAYVNNKIYSFEIWEDDIKYDDYIGKGTIKKPVGVIFTISEPKAL